MSRNLQWILCAVQDFDISVNRAMELIECERAGTFTDDMMPCDARSRHLFGLRDIPVQKYEALLAERDELAAKLAELENQEPIGEVTHSDVLPNADEKYRHEFVSDFRIGVQAELYARPAPVAETLDISDPVSGD